MSKKWRNRNRKGQLMRGHRLNIKYTEEDVIEIMEKMLSYVKETPSLLYIKEVYDEYDFTYNSMKNLLDNRFTNHDEIQRMRIKIKEILESRVVANALRGNISASFAKFFLINQSDNFVDEKRVDITTNGKDVGLEKEVDNEINNIMSEE